MTNTARLVDNTGNTLLTLGDANLGTNLRSLDLGFPTIRESTTPLAGQDGELDLTALVGGRAITAELDIDASSAGTTLDSLRALMHPGRRYWLYVFMDGWTAERCIPVRGAAFTAPTGGMPWAAQLSWKAPSPTFQAVTLSSVTLNPAASAAGGQTLPETFPEVFTPGLVPGASILSVAGSASASPFVDIYGPCSAPLFRVVDTGAQLSFPGLSIAQGDYLHIDVAARTITLNNNPAQSQYATLDFASSSWPTLPPGSPQVVFSPASTSSGCVAVVSWYSQWL